MALGRLYDTLDYWWEVQFYTALRPIICGNVEGNVLELGVGTGRNLAYYPSGAIVSGVDISKEQIEVARGRAKEDLRCTVRELVVGNAADLK